MKKMQARQVYADIIDLPHHRSPTRRPMPLRDRAAQFAPFAALTGYEDMVAEAARLTQTRRELFEEEQAELNRTLGLLQHRIAQGDAPRVRIRKFVPDERKAGGREETVSGRVKRVDYTRRLLILLADNGVSSGQALRLTDVCELTLLSSDET